MADPLSDLRFSRMVRTPHSERYALLDADDEMVGVLDIHYACASGVDYIHGSVILLTDVEQEDEEAIVDLINEEMVQGFAPGWAQVEFVLDVYVGKRISTYSDTEDYADDDLGDIVDDEF